MAALFDDWYDWVNPYRYAQKGTRVGKELWKDASGVTAAEGAARSQREGVSEASAATERMFEKGLETQRPWLEAGQRGLSQLEAGIGSGAFDAGPGGYEAPQFDFEADPGYQFRLSEGVRAREAGAASKGGLFSGATGRALEEYGQGLASQEYDRAYGRFANERGFGRGVYESDRGFDRASGMDRYNRLASLSGVGQATATNVAGQQMMQGGNLANLALTRGNIGAERSMAGYEGGMNLVNTGLEAWAAMAAKGKKAAGVASGAVG